MRAAGAQTTSSSNTRGPAGGEVTPARVRRVNKNPTRTRDRERYRVNIGTSFQSWRMVKDSCGLKSDEDVAMYLLDVMKANSSSSRSDKLKIRISKSEIKRMIEQEVCKAKAESETKMKSLFDSIQKMSHDIDFENTLQKLQSQMKRVSTRAEAAIAFVTETQKQSVPSSTDNLDSISRDSAGDATETTPMNKKKMECADKSEELHKMMEKTKTALKEIRAQNEVLTEAGIRQEEAPPILSPYESWTETNDKGKHSVLEGNADTTDHSVEEPPPLLVPTDSSEQPVSSSCEIQEHRKLKRQSEDSQEEENVSKNTEEPKVKKSKEDRSSLSCGVNSASQQELLFYPALPVNPFPSSLSIDAASYSVPQKVQLKLALIRNPTRLSVLWNVVEEDPSAPPMDSYTIFLTIEKVKGSGIFPRWHSYDHLKATSLPMCALIKKYKPGHKVCAAVVGKDIFGRYGPYSSVVTATMPE